MQPQTKTQKWVLISLNSCANLESIGKFWNSLQQTIYHLKRELLNGNLVMSSKTREERWVQCQQLLAKGWSFNDISKFLKMSSKTVAKVSKGLAPATRPPGRPKTLTSEHIRFIEVNSLANARLTDEEVAEMTRSRFGISVSRITVCRVRQKLGFVYRPPKAVQALTEEQKKVRLDFCNWIWGPKHHFFRREPLSKGLWQQMAPH